MKIRITHAPSYALATIQLDVEESILAESGAMVAMSGGLRTRPSTPGGLTKALSRKFLSQESFFLNRFTATHPGAWVSLAPPLPGDIKLIPIPPDGLTVQSGSYLASESSLEVSTSFGGISRIIGREGAFVLTLTGRGKALIAAYGGIERIDLDAQQTLIVDTGHYVASSSSMPYEIRLLEGAVTSAASGEGLVALIKGPGAVFIQTRSPKELRSWLMPERKQNK